MTRPHDLDKFDSFLKLRIQKKLKKGLKKLQIRKKKLENLENYSFSDYIRAVLAQHLRVETLKKQEIVIKNRIEKLKKVEKCLEK